MSIWIRTSDGGLMSIGCIAFPGIPAILATLVAVLLLPFANAPWILSAGLGLGLSAVAGFQLLRGKAAGGADAGGPEAQSARVSRRRRRLAALCILGAAMLAGSVAVALTGGCSLVDEVMLPVLVRARGIPLSPGEPGLREAAAENLARMTFQQGQAWMRSSTSRLEVRRLGGSFPPAPR